MGKKHNSKYIIGFTFIITVMIIITLGGVLLLNSQIKKTAQLSSLKDKNEYSKYYVLISSNNRSSFWKEVYQGAKKIAEENQAYLELLGDNLSEDYSVEQLLRIAIDSNVDGIILDADESNMVQELINEAVEKKIPVVTAWNDCSKSKRQSFVGISSYNLGKEYGKEVMAIFDDFFSEKKEKTVMNVKVLVDASVEGTSQNIIFTGIQDTIEVYNERKRRIKLEMQAVNYNGAFAAEESIRDIFMAEEALPDVIICLNEINTTCTYQAVVDFNKVGVVNIIGYYDSDTIVSAIARNVIYATITVDAEKLGENCLEALHEYDSTGNVNSFISIDTTTINEQNVMQFLGGEKDEK